MQLAAGLVHRQAFHAAVAAALGQHGRQLARAGAGLVALEHHARRGIDLDDEGAVFVRGPEHLGRVVIDQAFAVQALGIETTLGTVIAQRVVQRNLQAAADHAERRGAAGDPGIGVGLQRQEAGGDRTTRTHLDHADGRREARCREHLGDAGGAGLVGTRCVRAVAIGAAVGDAPELEAAIGRLALEGQARADGRVEALGKILLRGGVRALVGHEHRGIGLQLVLGDEHIAAGRGLRALAGLGLAHQACQCRFVVLA